MKANLAQQVSVARVMGSDHAQLEQLFEAVLTCLRCADAERIRERWLALDQALQAHLALEEELLLPRFEREYPAAAARLRHEHREIRRALVELGVDLDLHELCPASAGRFIATLRDHAEYEEAVLYPWAQRHLGELEKASLSARLRRAWSARGPMPTLLEERHS